MSPLNLFNFHPHHNKFSQSHDTSGPYTHLFMSRNDVATNQMRFFIFLFRSSQNYR